MSLANPEIVSLGKDPAGVNPPAGESVRFDPEFEQLSAEIAKAESLTSGTTDWGSAVQLATSLLKNKTKDYRIAAYLVFGLFRTKGINGLLSGLRMYEALIRSYWETGYPEKGRMRGRIGALEWLKDHMASTLQRGENLPASSEVILELEKATQDFVATLGEFMGEQAPDFAEMVRSVSSRANEIRSQQVSAERAREDESRRTQGIESGEITDPSDADRVLDSCRERLRHVAAFLFRNDPANPLSYRITRGTTWGWIVDLPSNDSGTTHIPPFTADALRRCEAGVTAGDWHAVVNETESSFPESVLAFDFQRHAVHAMSELGESFDAAKAAIMSEFSALLYRLPGMLDLSFNDGTPFADSSTRSWIASQLLRKASGNAADAGENKGTDDPSKLDAEARRLLGLGKLEQAVALYQDGIAKSLNLRQRFLWRLRLAKLCLEAERPRLALPQLMFLDEDVKRFSLEEWEPDLSLDVVRQLFICRQRLAAGLQERAPDTEHVLQELYQRLCRLDVNAAVAIDF